jgi:hypothetical protein
MQPSEKRLLLILGVAVFLVLNMLGLRSFLISRKGIAAQIMAAKTSLAEDKGWIEIGETMRPADDWIKGHPMPSMPADDASALLLKTERDAAEKAGLKVTEENLLAAVDSPLGSTVGVSVKLSGPFSGVVKFLYSMQDPAAWRVIQKLTLRSDTQPPNVLADAEILQYFRPKITTDTAGSSNTP